MATLGEVLKLFRLTEEDRSIRSVAKEMGVSSTYISEVEKGNKKPSLDMLKRFSECYEIPVSEFFRIEEISTEKEFTFAETFLEVVITWFKYHDTEVLERMTFKIPSKL